MDGILVIDKPAGMTSHDVVAKVRRVLKTKRVGHTGTLDPFATGVLVLVVGRATRLAQFLDKDVKEYEATVRFGWETETGDATGTRRGDAETERRGDEDRKAEVGERLNVVDWEKVFERFRGEIDQVPPMYSAKKVDGRKLYELARKGEQIERKAAKVNILELEKLGEPDGDLLRIRVACSAGTYIRTLAEDIGRAIGIGAHLTELRRTRAGRYSLEDAVELDALAEMDEPATQLLAVENAVAHLPSLKLSEDRAKKTLNGLSTRIFDRQFTDGETLQMLDADGELIAIGIYNAEEQCIKPKIVLV